MSFSRSFALTLSCAVVLGACKESDSLPFSIEVTPQTVTREVGEMLEATLTVTSRSGEYANQRVQVDVVQLGGGVIDELNEGDVGGMVEGFMPIDPEMSGLGVRWKRMSWTLASDAPSRQRDFRWVCDEGTTAAFFFVTVDGEAVSAPTGPTWRVVRSGASLEPPVADVIERELGLTPDRELELLPIGCGEDPDAGPRDDGGVADAPVADGDGVDGGPGEEGRTISGFDVREYGMSANGTIWFTAGNPGQELYYVPPGDSEDATQRSSAAEIGAVLGTTVTSYGVGELSVTADGAAVLRVQTDSDNCLMIARSTSWSRVLCEDDDLGDGVVEGFGQWAVVADDTVGFVVLMGVRVAGVFRVIWVVDTGSDILVSEVARTMGAMPGLDTTSGIELIDNLVLSPSGLGGYRMKAFDGTVAVYSDDAGAGPELLAWMDVRASPPAGAPVTPPAEVNISAYSFGNRPIDGLTVNADGTFAWVMKIIGVDGLLDGSGIYVSEPAIRNAIPLPGGLLTNTGASVGIESGISALPAMQYALLDDGSIVMNGRWRDTDTPGQTIWRLDADDVAGILDPITGTGNQAPGREGGSMLGADITFASLGPMVVSSDGAIAFAALLEGTGIDENNNAGIFATSPDGLVMVERFGEEIDLGGAPVALDILDMASAGVRVPPLPLGDEPLAGDFLVIDVRDTHVVFGPGSDGRGSNFGTAGCGIPLYRAGSFFMSSENALFAVPLPGICL